MPARARTIASCSITLLLVASLLLAPPAWGQNENEEIGFSSKHIFEGDYFGENVDVLNGNLVLTIPIGPKFRVSVGLEYGLALTYNSKIWLEQLLTGGSVGLMGSTFKAGWDAQTQKQIQNAGLGFRLHLGRIYFAKRVYYPTPAAEDLVEGSLSSGWYYQDQHGTNHPLMYCPDTEMINSEPNRSDPPEPKQVCPFDGTTNHYATTDGTYMRAKKIIEGGKHVGWELWPGDGTKHTFGHHAHRGTDPKAETDVLEIRGFYVTRIEGVEKFVTTDPVSGARVVTPYNYIKIEYDDSPNNEHSIKRIAEFRLAAGGSEGLPEREIRFTNVSSLTVDSCRPGGGQRSISVHGGLVNSVDLPSFEGNRATYDFEYCIDDISVPPFMSTCTTTGCKIFSSVPLLRSLRFPATAPSGVREEMRFSYNVPSAPTWTTHGELTERQLPTGARTRYEYGYYDYGMQFLTVASGYRKGVSATSTACKCTDTRQIVKKTVFESASDSQPDTWTYIRNGDLPRVGSSAAIAMTPTRVHVIDPEGNETVYHHWSGDDELLLYLSGLNHRTETYLGRWGTGKLIRTELSGYAQRGTDVPSRRADIQRVRRQMMFSDDGPLASQHRQRFETWSFDAFGNELSHAESEIDATGRPGFSRTTKRIWKTGSQLTPFEKATWLIHLQQEEKLLDGQGKLQRRTMYTLTEEGRVRAELRLARPDAGPMAEEDLQTVYCFDGDDLVSTPPVSGEIFPFYDPTAGSCTSEPNPDQIRSGNIVLKKLSGGATAVEPNPPTREIEYKYQAGAYLAGKRFRENGVALGWWAFERDRDLSTGLIWKVRDTAGVQTLYHYDSLGRLDQIDPDSVFGQEETTEVRYPSLTRTVVLQGSSAILADIPYDSASPCTVSGDYTCTEYRYDGLARLAQTRKRRHDASLAAEHRCYTPSGRLSEQSEWISIDTAFSCGESAGAPRTRTYYSSATDARTDPLGRPRRVLSADGFLTEYEYSGEQTTIKVHVTKPPAADVVQTTIQVKDAFGRLIKVDSDGGADAVYIYDAEDHLVEVALGAQRRLFTYDALGRLREEVHPENGRTLYLAFDPLGNVLRRQDARSFTFRRAYDGAGRLQQEEFDSGSGWALLARNWYDDGQFGLSGDLTSGRLTRVESFDDAGVLVSDRKLGYTALNGRLGRADTQISGWQAWLRTTYRYNSFGLLDEIQYPGEPTWLAPLMASYQYSNGYLSRASTVNAPNNLVAKALTYNLAGGLQSWEGGNGVRTTIEVDSRNRPGRIFAERLSADQQSARILDPEAYDLGFFGNLAALVAAPHLSISGSEPVADDSQSLGSPIDAQASGEPKRDPPGGGGSNPEDTYGECHDGLDSDNDGKADCADSGCSPYCVPESTCSACSDAVDNDGDFLSDCSDPGCAGFCISEESYDACSDGIDNDCDSALDCADTYCQSVFCGPNQPENTIQVCTDRKDNDWDGRFDCADPNCRDCATPGLCTNGVPLACRYLDTGVYAYDGAGNIAAMGSDVFGYDRLNRLVSTTLASAGDNRMAFSYDGFGNMLSWQKLPPGFTVASASRTFSVDPSTNRMDSVSINRNAYVPYQYDAPGNLVRDDRYLYEYDARNRIKRVRALDSTEVASFLYDASGQRLAKNQGGRTTFYLRDSEGNVLTEFTRNSPTDQPAWSKAYVYAGSMQLGLLSVRETQVEPPPRVGAQIAGQGGNRRIRVYWKDSPSADVVGYFIYRRTATTAAIPLNSVPVGGNLYEDAAGLVDGETYNYSVQSIDRDGNRSPLSSEWALKFSSETPANLRWVSPVAQSGSTSITAHWALDPGASQSALEAVTGFRIVRYRSPDEFNYAIDSQAGPNGILNDYVGPYDGVHYFFPLEVESYWNSAAGLPAYKYRDTKKLVSGYNYLYQACSMGRSGEAVCVIANTSSCNPSFIDTPCARLLSLVLPPPPPAEGLPEGGTLQPPAGFTAKASPTPADAIDLFWTRVGQANMTGYRVYQEVEQTGGSVVLRLLKDSISPTATAVTLTGADGIAANTMYRLRVAAYVTGAECTPAGSSGCALSEAREVRTRSATLKAPLFRIKSAVCEPNDDDPPDPQKPDAHVVCSQHKEITRQGEFRLRIEDGVGSAVSRNGDTSSRFGFRLYFRPCTRSGQCGEWKTGLEASHGTIFEGSVGGESPLDPSLAGIFTADLKYWLSNLVNQDAGNVYCNGVDGSQYVCAPYWWKARHGCEIGDYALSTVRGHLEGGEYVIDEESVLSAYKRFDPYERFRNLIIYDKSAQLYRARLRAFTPCNVKVVGIGMDGHLKGEASLKKCGDTWDRTIGYRIFWMPLPYCGVKGYNVYKIPTTSSLSNGHTLNTIEKGPLGQLGYDDPDTTEDLSTLVKLNTELITGYHFDYYPPTDSEGFFTGSPSDLPSYITVEAVLDPVTLPSGYDPGVNWRDRFSCPRAAAGQPSTALTFPKAYLTCASAGSRDNGLCWCGHSPEGLAGIETEDMNQNGVWDTGKCANTGAMCVNDFDCGYTCGGTRGGCVGAEDIKGAFCPWPNTTTWIPNDKLEGGCARPDFVAGALSTGDFVGTDCEMSEEDPEGLQYMQQIWARVGENPLSDPTLPLPVGGVHDLFLAYASPQPQALARPEDRSIPTHLACDRGAARRLAIAGIAHVIEEEFLSVTIDGDAVKLSPHRLVGSTTIPVNDVTYYHNDHLGSVRLTTDRRGYRVRSTVYWPFGDEAEPAAWDTNTHRFTGHERDTETGLDYMLARYYSAGLSRFLSADPEDDSEMENPQSWNRYSYVRNNPLRYADPHGTCIWDACVIEGTAGTWAIAGTIATVGVLASPAPDGSGRTNAQVMFHTAMTALDNLSNSFSKKKRDQAINRFIELAEDHIGLLMSSSPNDPNRNQWRVHAEKAIKNLLKVAKRTAGKTKEALEKTARSLRDRLKGAAEGSGGANESVPPPWQPPDGTEWWGRWYFPDPWERAAPENGKSAPRLPNGR